MSRKATASRRGEQADGGTEIAAVARPALPARGEDLHIPLSSQALFWRPHHPAASPALGQLPFVFWLIEAIRPRTIMQHGIGDGVVYMALCQASERLGGGTICRGAQADEPFLSPAMRAQHDERYADFSALHRGDPKALAARLGSEIDLLVLNQALDAQALAGFEEEWLPLLSDRAVILVCGPDRMFADTAPPRSLTPRPGRSVVLAPVSGEGHAMEVLLHGADQAERLMALAAQRPGDAAYLAARQVFTRLGQGMEAVQKLERLQKERSTPRAAAQAATGDLAADAAESVRLRAEITALRGQLAAAQAAQEKRLEDIASLTAKYTDDLARSKSENDRLAVAKSQLEMQLSTARASQETRIRELEDEIMARDVQHRIERDEAGRAAAELSGRLEAAVSEVERLQTVAAELHGVVAEMHRVAGEELGRAVKALLPDGKSGLWRKKISVADQARLLVDKRIVEPEWYLERHPDVAAAGMDPALHYLLHGADEGRIPRRALDEASRLPGVTQPG